jgi:hypothetical protein
MIIDIASWTQPLRSSKLKIPIIYMNETDARVSNTMSAY